MGELMLVSLHLLTHEEKQACDFLGALAIAMVVPTVSYRFVARRAETVRLSSMEYRKQAPDTLLLNTEEIELGPLTVSCHQAFHCL